MKTLVTGGAGFIGSHTVDLLLERGHTVRILDSLTPPVHPERKKPEYISSDVNLLIGDVRNSGDMEKAMQGIDVVFHFAAHQGYLTDFSTFAFVNDGGVALLYEIIVNEHLPVRKVILGSSQAVYGEGKYHCKQHGIQYPPPRSLEQLERGAWEVKCPVCKETMQSLPTDESRTNPHNQYAVSKYCQELYALTLGKRYDIPTAVLRYSITQGPRQSFYNAYSGTLRSFTIRLLNKLPAVIYEDGRQRRDYVYVGDVARANLLVMENEVADYQVFNVGGSEPITVLEYTQILQRLTGKDIAPEIHGEFRVGDSRHVISDISKLRNLGWEPETPVERIAHEYIEWLEAQPAVSDYYADARKVMRQAGVIRSVAQIAARS